MSYIIYEKLLSLRNDKEKEKVEEICYKKSYN